jgi:HPr kinase/phosphorylase
MFQYKTNGEPKISVADFVKNAPAELDVEELAGENGLRQKQIVSSRIQKLGLVLARFSHYTQAERIQIVEHEASYLAQLKSEQRIEALNYLDLDKISGVLITKNLEHPPEFKTIAEEKICLFSAPRKLVQKPSIWFPTIY